MKNYILLFLALSILAILSCKKDKDCALNGTGKINIDNESLYEYEITMNMDTTFLLQPGGETTLTVPVGEHSLIASRTDALGGIIPPIGFTPEVDECKTINLGIDN